MVGPAEVPPFNKIKHLNLSKRHNGPQKRQRFSTECLFISVGGVYRRGLAGRERNTTPWRWDPGKYDDVCTMVTEKVGIGEQGGGVIVIVLGGNKGNGFACQADLRTTLLLPDLLEDMARQIRKDGITG